MDNKTKGMLLGVGGVILWFTPFVYVRFMGVNAYQTGQHIGGIAYLLIVSSVISGAASWMENHALSLIAAAVSVGICVLFVLQAGSDAGWGLLALLAVSIASALLAYRARRATAAP